VTEIDVRKPGLERLADVPNHFDRVRFDIGSQFFEGVTERENVVRIRCHVHFNRSCRKEGWAAVTPSMSPMVVSMTSPTASPSGARTSAISMWSPLEV